MWYSCCSCQCSPHLPVSLTLRYLYWLSSGQVRRYPLNLEVNCREKEELIPTNLSTVNDFALNTSSLETVLYRVNGSHLSVSGPDPGDMETVSRLFVLACVRMYIHVCTAAVYSACYVLSVYVYTYVLTYFIVRGRCDAFEDLCTSGIKVFVHSL